MSVSLGSAHGDIILDGSGAAKGVSQAVGALGTLERVAAAVGGSFAKFAVGLGVAAVQGTAAVGAGLAGMTAIAVKTAGDLEQAVANIASIKPDIDTSAVFSALNTLSTEVPQTATQLADSLYNIFSSIETTQEGALQLVEQFAQGATGAQTDALTFGTAILGVMNAYGVAVEDATHISDVFFNTVNRGVVTGEELAGALGPVTQSAKLAGVSIDELGALIAGVTKEGGPAAQNINNLNNTLQKITTTKAQNAINDLGVATTTADGQYRSMIDILSDLQPKLAAMTEAQRANALQEIFPDLQARQGAATLINQLDFVRETLRLNQEEAGAAGAAFRTMVSTFNSQSALLRNTVTSIGRAFGAELLPLATQGIVGLQRLLANATPTITVFGRRLAASLTAGIESFGDALPSVIARARNFMDIIGNLIDALRGRGGFDEVRRQIEIAFGGSAVGRFVSLAVRGMQLIIDAVHTAQAAARGEWFGGQDRSIQVFVRAIGRAVQLVRDAILTVRDALRGDWMPSDQIQPVVNAFGRIASAAGSIWRALQTAGRALAAAFTPERVAILQRLWDQFLNLQGTINGIRLDVLVGAMQLLAAAITTAAPYLADFVGALIDFIGRAQEGGVEADILRGALILLGAWVATNKLADLIGTLSNIGKSASDSARAVSDFWKTLTRGPRLVTTVIRTAYQTVGKAIDTAQTVGGVVTRTISVVFAGAKDAALWAQLYAEQAVQVITRQIRTIYEALPPAPSLPNLVQKVIPQIDTTGLGSTQLPTIDINANVKIPAPNLGTTALDIGTKLAGGIAAGIGGAIGAALVASGALAAVGTAFVAALPYILAALAIVAVAAAAFFVGQWIANFVAQAGGIGPALSQVFLVAIPTALGALTGLLVNAGLQMIVWILQGLTAAIPLLVGFISSNFQAIIITITGIFLPLPTLIFGILSQILPFFVAMGTQILAAVGTAFSQIGTIITTTLGSLAALVGGTIQGIIGVFLSMGAQILGAIQAAFAPLGAMIQAIISGNWGAAVQAGIQFIVALFVTFPQQVIGILTGGFSAIVGIIGSALGQAASIVGAAFAGIVSAVTTAGASILAAVTSAFSSVRETIGSILSGIGDAITTALGNFVKGFQSTFNTELVAEVQSGMAALKTAVTSGLTTVVGLFTNLGADIKGAIGDLAGALYKIGADAVAGLANGIRGAIGSVVSAAQAIADAIPGPIKNLLKISSPSKVMADIGQDTGEGLAVGIEAATPEVVNAARDLARAIADTITAGVEALSSLGRVQGVSDQSLALFSSGLRRLIQMLVELAAEFSEDGLAAAKLLAENAKGILDLVVPAVEAFDALAGVTEPTADALGVFGAGVGNLTRIIVAIARDFDGETLAAASVFAEAALKIINLVLPAVEAFDALRTITEPTADQLGVFMAGIINIVLVMVQAAAAVGLDALPAAAIFAEVAAKAVALVVPAVEAFAALRDVVEPTADQLGVFMAGIGNLVSVVAQASRLFAADALPHARDFADTAAKAIALIGPAVAGFAKLAEITQPTADQLGVLMAGIINVSSVIVQASRLFAADALPHATAFADYASKAIGLIGPAVAGFAALADGDLALPDQGRLDAFAGTVANLARAIAAAAATMAAEVAADAGVFAEQAQKVVALLGNGVKGLMDLVEFEAPTDAAIAAFVATVVNVVRRVAAASETIEKEAAEAAAIFAENAGKAVQLIGTAISALTIEEKVDKEGNATSVSRLISTAEIDALVALVGHVARRMIDLGKQFNAGDLNKMTALADAASKGLGALKGMLDTISTVKDEKEGDAETITPAQAIDQLIALFAGGVARLAALATIADQYKRAAFAIRDTMREAMAALSGAIGTLPFGEGIGAAQLALATSNGQFLIRAEVIHRHDPVEFRIMGENGPWIVRSLEIDGKSREQVAGMVGELLMGDGQGTGPV